MGSSSPHKLIVRVEVYDLTLVESARLYQQIHEAVKDVVRPYNTRFGMVINIIKPREHHGD